MFYPEERRKYLTALLLSTSHNERRNILNTILPLHLEDYLSMFRHANMYETRFSVTLIGANIPDFLPKCISSCVSNYKDEIKSIMGEFNASLTNEDIAQMPIECRNFMRTIR